VARAVAPGSRGGRAVVVVDGNPTWDALNAAISAADDMTAEETLRVARALNATGPLEEVTDPRGAAARRDRIAVLSRKLRALKIKRERLVTGMGRNTVLLKRARFGLTELRDALRGVTGTQAQALRSSIERLENYIKRLEGTMIEDQGQLSLIDSLIADIESELEALMFG
jgi:hypothetical protein